MCADPLLSHFTFFFFNDTATTEIYTLSLHDALPISPGAHFAQQIAHVNRKIARRLIARVRILRQRLAQNPLQLGRSEEHTSELQSPCNLVCRLLLEKKKKIQNTRDTHRHEHSHIHVT